MVEKRGGEVCTIDELQDDELYVLFSSLASCLLRRSKKAGNRQVDGTLTFLSLVERVMADNRVDTVFAPIRQVARGQILTRAGQSAMQQGCLDGYRQLVGRVFDGTPLADCVDLLEEQS